MSTTIFVTLPVKDPKKSKAFYEALGFKQNPAFPEDMAACVMISDAISVMFAPEEQFKQISHKPMADPKTCGVLLSLTCDSKEEVEALVAKAVAAGGSKAHEFEDYGTMYQGAFYDPDGHGWGLTWMNPNAE